MCLGVGGFVRGVGGGGDLVRVCVLGSERFRLGLPVSVQRGVGWRGCVLV